MTVPKRRERVERGIYRRPDGKLEIGWRDAQGTQRWRVVDGGITAARSALAGEVAKRAKGERIAADPRLTFGQAADRWLNGPVATLRPNTRDAYRNAVDNHLRRRLGRRRLDDITPDDLARVVVEMRAAGLSEWTISSVLMVAGQVFRHAARRLGWHGTSPTMLLERGERPHVASTARRRIFRGDELARTIVAAKEPYRTLFATAAITAARESELLGLVWRDVELGSEPEIRFAFQVDRKGRRVSLKTDDSHGAVPIPPSLALMLTEHKLRSAHSGPDDFVFTTRIGTPINQRNVLKALRTAMKAATHDEGRPMFPVLHELDVGGQPKPVPRNAVPCFHSFRHTAASAAFADGERIEDVAWLLRHASPATTRAVYLHEIRDAEAKAARRARMEALGGSSPQQTTDARTAEVRDLQADRYTRQQITEGRAE